MSLFSTKTRTFFSRNKQSLFCHSERVKRIFPFPRHAQNDISFFIPFTVTLPLYNNLSFPAKTSHAELSTPYAPVVTEYVTVPVYSPDFCVEGTETAYQISVVDVVLL